MSLRIESQELSKLARAEPLSHKIADLLMRKIISGALKPGERLPTEHELCTLFDVSRNVVREAVACLRADGLVSARQGLGAFVNDPTMRQTIRLDRETLREPGNIGSLFELRSMIEIETAGLAAQRRTSAQLRAIALAFDRMSGSEKWSEEGIDADLEFHRLVAEATGNSYLVTFLGFLSQHLRSTIVEARAKHEEAAIIETTLTEHRHILEAISKKNPDAAREAMRFHIQGAAKRLDLAIPFFSLGRGPG